MEKDMAKEGRLRPYEPLLMTLARLLDAFLGAILLLGWAYYFQMYQHEYLVLVFLIFFIALVCLHASGVYRSWRTSAFFGDEIRRLLAACLAIYIVYFGAVYFLKVSTVFSRRVMLAWMLSWPVLLTLGRLALRSFLKYQRQKGHNIRTCVIMGAGDLGIKLGRRLTNNPWSGAKLIGFFDDKVKTPVEGYPILGNLEEITSFIQQQPVDIVYLTLPMRAESKIQRLVGLLGDSTASIYLVPDIFFFDIIFGGIVTFFEDLPIVALRDTPLRGFNALLKRTEDLVFSSLMLLASLPILVVIAILIKLTSPGPVLFKQWRYGLNGKPFQIYKFRTMSVCEDGYQFKQTTPGDTRVTRLGALLRKISLDEMPQLINVLQGRMSIVGPRPHPVAMNETFRKLVPGYMLRHKVRPGLTGLAQINGWRGETDTLDKMKKRIEDDLQYLRHWSIFLDLKIIFKTAIIVFQTPAY
jgi:putative colanic acid biosynthesis UDP-glucose lipid carrier transferase